MKSSIRKWDLFASFLSASPILSFAGRASQAQDQLPSPVVADTVQDSQGHLPAIPALMGASAPLIRIRPDIQEMIEAVEEDGASSLVPSGTMDAPGA